LPRRLYHAGTAFTVIARAIKLSDGTAEIMQPYDASAVSSWLRQHRAMVKAGMYPEYNASTGLLYHP
jgi:hypothetical protein